ncbi:hypothetical protein Moror_11184 [Moniliophthora roreri MCA 2997]|uniref:Uncharacterized protein n=2 Tax=Moniliophthora roreri TaxID=221103 RepID=V2WM81_MONRO|nr:hypothetical protein Moror_11184 [Moniliophthora roreri MCA 2997]
MGQVIDHNADKLSNAILEMSKRLESVEKKTSAQGDAINLIGSKLQTMSDDIKQLSGMRASLNIYLMDVRWERKNTQSQLDVQRLDIEIEDLQQQIKLLDDQSKVLLGQAPATMLLSIPPPSLTTSPHKWRRSVSPTVAQPDDPMGMNMAMQSPQ